MKEFKIPVEWVSYGVVVVEANNLEEAIKIAKEDENIPLPEANYLESSWKVYEDMEFINILNK